MQQKQKWVNSLSSIDTEGLTNRGAFVAAKTEIGEQPLVHTSQTGLQELNNLGYSLAVTAAVAAPKSLQLCPTLHDPMNCSLPGSSIHRIFQARVLEWGAIAFSVSCYYKQTLVAGFVLHKANYSLSPYR